MSGLWLREGMAESGLWFDEGRGVSGLWLWEGRVGDHGGVFREE